MNKDLKRICDTLIERYGYENVDDILLDIEEIEQSLSIDISRKVLRFIYLSSLQEIEFFTKDAREWEQLKKELKTYFKEETK